VVWAVFVIPAFFTFFGAALGFVSSEIKDALLARRSKRAFLEAVAVELAALKKSLEQAAEHAKNFAVMAQAAGHAPQLVPRWGTRVFDTQLGKLRDVADKLILQTIDAYAPVGRIEQIAVMVNENSRDFATAEPGNEKAEAQKRLVSAATGVGGRNRFSRSEDGCPHPQISKN